MVFDAGNQNLLALLQQVILDRPDVLDVADVLVEAWVNGHVLGADSEPFTVLVLVFDVENEWDASGVFGHHFLQETHRQVHALDNQRLVALVALVYDLGEFFCDECALFLVTLESDLLF